MLFSFIFKFSRETRTITSAHIEEPHAAVQLHFMFWVLFHVEFDLIPVLSQLCTRSHAPFFRLVKQCSYSHRTQGNGKWGADQCIGRGMHQHPSLLTFPVTTEFHRLPPVTLCSSRQGKFPENRETVAAALLCCSLLWQQQCCLTVLYHRVR